MTAPIGVGLIGANPHHAWAAISHIPAIAALPDFELLAVSTSRRKSAAEAERAFNVTAYDNASSLLGHPGVDLVVVAVRTPNHRPLILAALEAGKHVYCEWPLGNGLDEAIELNEAAKRAGVRTFMGLQARSSPATAYMRDLVADGYVGRVLSTSMVASCWVYGETISLNNAYMVEKAAGANMLTVQVAHVADVMAYVLGDEFRDVVASFAILRPEVRVEETGQMLKVNVPDNIALSGTLESGASASIHIKGGTSRAVNMQWLVTGTDGELLLDGTSAHLSTDDQGPPRLLGAQGETPEVAPLDIPARYRWVPSEIPQGPPYNIAQHYALVAQDLRDGSQRVPDFEHAVMRHRLVAALDLANETGERQRFGPNIAAAA
jgi:predicted dehydrogenase